MIPLAVFAHSRPQYLHAALSSLARCARFDECKLFVFCDGWRTEAERPAVEATRRIAQEWSGRVGCDVVEQPTNLGLARSIAENVTALCKEFGRIIVVEDDLFVSPDFLDFMLNGLDRYAADQRVYQIGGFMYPLNTRSWNDAVFLPYTSSWGWATWWRAWTHYDSKMVGWEQIKHDQVLRRKFDLDGAYPFSASLLNQGEGRDSTWDIQWYWTLFKAEGLGLYPRRSLVWNGGIFGAATHEGVVAHSPEPREIFDSPRLSTPLSYPGDIGVDESALRAIRRYLLWVGRMEGHTHLTRLLYSPLRVALQLRQRLRSWRRP